MLLCAESARTLIAAPDAVSELAGTGVREPETLAGLAPVALMAISNTVANIIYK